MAQIAVIIPTYNRALSLRKALLKLADQSLGDAEFEVIVVDDGSTDDTAAVAAAQYPFQVLYLKQSNQGDAAARNTGVANTTAELMVFIDDDVYVEPGYLSALLWAHSHADRVISAGRMYLAVDTDSSRFLRQQAATAEQEQQGVLEFARVSSNNMSLRRQDYIELGGMEGLGFPGSDIWCDVDFCYRAYLRDYAFLRVQDAICYHDDYTLQDLATLTQRMEKVAFRAPFLFQRYPGLVQHLPMFADMLPICSDDSARVKLRKSLRGVTAAPPMLRTLEYTANRLSQTDADFAAAKLSRWIVGAHIYRGYRQGMAALSSGAGRDRDTHNHE